MSEIKTWNECVLTPIVKERDELLAKCASLTAALADRDAKLAALKKQEPVAEVLLINGEKTVDASLSFFDKSPIGTRLYAAAGAAPSKCPHCNGTGDVHRLDGEWLGVCTCEAGGAYRYSTPGAAPKGQLK